MHDFAMEAMPLLDKFYDQLLIYTTVSCISFAYTFQFVMLGLYLKAKKSSISKYIVCCTIGLDMELTIQRMKCKIINRIVPCGKKWLFLISFKTRSF